jgi:hypothetical protein
MWMYWRRKVCKAFVGLLGCLDWTLTVILKEILEISFNQIQERSRIKIQWSFNPTSTSNVRLAFELTLRTILHTSFDYVNLKLSPKASTSKNNKISQ